MAGKGDRLKARLPRGLADRGPADIRATEAMLATIRGVYERYGFEPVETPLIEYSDALGKFLPDQDRPNEGVFSFRDEDSSGEDRQEAGSAPRVSPSASPRTGSGATGKDRGEWLSLRYDLTAPLARHVAENYERLPKPYRSYRAGWVFRNEKPGPGRFRQFMQFDADTVGAASPAADAEMCMMAADTLEALGIPRGQYVIKVNSRKVLDGVMEAVGLAGAENAGRRLTVLRAIDKLDRLGIGEIHKLLGAGRTDDSGDVTRGANLQNADIATILNFATGRGETWRQIREHNPPTDDEWIQSGETLAETTTVPPLPEQELFFSNARLLDYWQRQFGASVAGAAGVTELRHTLALMESAGYGSRRFRISGSVVRGLEYYTGAVFEAELLFPVSNDEGQPVVFGSVGGGGRYDGLVGRFGGQDVPATGFSIGVSRLQAALKALGKSGGGEARGPVVVLVMDRAPEAMARAQGFVAQLRAANLRDASGGIVGAELYLGDSGMKAQMKYADKRNSPCVIIQGGDELARGVVQIKDLAAGKALAANLASHEAYREGRPGQFEVLEGELVPAVRALILGGGA